MSGINEGPVLDILTGTRRFREYYQDNQDLFERLATQGQSPKVLFIGCSDSRVPPEMLTGSGPGELFVLRHLANIVPPFGTGEMGSGAVIEYAVLRLKVQHVVVCGHTGCGAIRALDVSPDWAKEPHIARWIEHARPARTKVEASGLPEASRPLATVRENVLLQLEHLRSYDPVREGERDGTLGLQGWVYHLETGFIEIHDPRTETWTQVVPPEMQRPNAAIAGTITLGS
jgi:carbonic anhydrase